MDTAAFRALRPASAAGVHDAHAAQLDAHAAQLAGHAARLDALDRTNQAFAERVAALELAWAAGGADDDTDG